MRHSRPAALAALLLSGGCAGLAAAVPPTPVLRAQASPAIANTGYITAPALVSAGMANILAYVPAQAGASYQWSVTGGAIPGVACNAAVYFNAGAAGTATAQCVVTLGGVQSVYTQDIPVAPVLAPTPFYYGSGLSADALATLKRTRQLAGHIETLQKLLPVCAWCKKVRSDSGYWDQIEKYITTNFRTQITHGICPECSAKMRQSWQIPAKPPAAPVA